LLALPLPESPELKLQQSIAPNSSLSLFILKMSGYPGYNGGGYAAPQQQYQQGGYYPYELPLIS
jgi:hypothetical protein